MIAIQLDLFPMPVLADIGHAIMRQELAAAEAENLDADDWLEILMDGCQGYNNMSDNEIEEIHHMHFGVS